MSTIDYAEDEPKNPPDSGSQKISAPAALRNREVIADAIGEFLPKQGKVLELASGTGEHICLFAQRFANLKWQPTDMDPSRLASIESHAAAEQLPNLAGPVSLNVAEDTWYSWEADVILAINLLHVAPKSVTRAVMSGASNVLLGGGTLIFYGPFMLNGTFSTESNRQFDLYLREKNPEWGLRDIADLDRAANAVGLARVALIDMPANNNLVVFQKRDVTPLD